MSAFHFRLKFLMGCVVFLTACHMPRDNVLDPRNADSYQPQKLLIEAFVNTDNDFSYNEYMLSALDSVTALYGDRIEILEYHRNTLNDSSAYHQNLSDIIYQKYITGTGGFKGVPHVFLNGIAENVQGAFSVPSALSRLQAMADAHLSDNSDYTIEVGFERNGNIITPVVKMARLGHLQAHQIKVRAVLSALIQNPFHKRVVVAGVKSNEIPEIAAGEIHRLTLSPMVFNGVQSLRLIVYVMDHSETQVLQCASVDVF